MWRDDAKQLAFLLLTQARFETHLALHVHEGNCRVHLGECEVARLMRKNRISALQKRRWRRTTDSRHKLPVAENILDRNFMAAAPNQVWAGASPTFGRRRAGRTPLTSTTFLAKGRWVGDAKDAW